MTRAILTGADLAGLVADLVGAGTRVVAPVPVGPGWDQTEYRPIARLEEAALDGAQPRHPLKEFFRASPRERGGTCRQVVLGARPCDAAGLDTLDQVMGWDYRDEEWLARRRATTVVTVACREVAPSCFCSAVGDGPASARGADVLLLPLETDALPPQRRRIRDQLRQCVDLFLFDSQPYPDAAEIEARGEPAASLADLRFTARALTEKGEALLRGLGAPCPEEEDERAAALARRAAERAERNVVALRLPRRRAPLGRDEEARLGILAADGGELVQPPAGAGEPVLPRVADWLARNVDHEVWGQAARRCRGCGNCSSVCSTSPCFDDAAPKRAERFRQRVIQKFSTHARRFQGVQCTGCGRCSRGCQGGIDLPAFLGQLVQLAAPERRIAT